MPFAPADVGAGEHGGHVNEELAAGEGGGERLLVVDDDPFIARLLEIELAAAGYVVRVANDGQQALEMSATSHPTS